MQKPTLVFGSMHAENVNLEWDYSKEYMVVVGLGIHGHHGQQALGVD